jgi:hypothetical protein
VIFTKDFNWTYIIRFIRTVVPQLVLLLPVLIARGQEFDKYLPFWVLPTLILLAGIFTALDKYFRDVGFYEEVKEKIVGV